MLAARELTVREQAHLAGALSASLGREVDLIDLRQASTALAYEVAKHGALVVERTAGRWASFRARVAHGYATLDPARSWTELPAGMNALDEYQQAVARFVDESAAT